MSSIFIYIFKITILFFLYQNYVWIEKNKLVWIICLNAQLNISIMVPRAAPSAACDRRTLLRFYQNSENGAFQKCKSESWPCACDPCALGLRLAPPLGRMDATSSSVCMADTHAAGECGLTRWRGAAVMMMVFCTTRDRPTKGLDVVLWRWPPGWHRHHHHQSPARENRRHRYAALAITIRDVTAISHPRAGGRAGGRAPPLCDAPKRGARKQIHSLLFYSLPIVLFAPCSCPIATAPRQKLNGTPPRFIDLLLFNCTALLE